MHFILKDHQLAMAVTFAVLLPTHCLGHAQILDIICTSYNNAPLNNKKYWKHLFLKSSSGLKCYKRSMWQSEQAAHTHSVARNKSEG